MGHLCILPLSPITTSPVIRNCVAPFSAIQPIGKEPKKVAYSLLPAIIIGWKVNSLFFNQQVLQNILSKQQRDRLKSKNSPFSTPSTKTVRRARYFHALSNAGSDGEHSSGEEDFLPSSSRVDLPMLLRSIIEEVERLKGEDDNINEQIRNEPKGFLIEKALRKHVSCQT